MIRCAPMLEVVGAQLFTVEIGDGPDVVLLLHGGPGASHDYLRPQLDTLAQAGKRRLFYYDQRGSGRSPLHEGTAPGGFAEHVADLEAVRLALGVERLWLCGYSWGALLAMLYAVEHPDRVARLALISPAPAASSERAEAGRRLAEMAKRPEVEALRARLDSSDRRNRFALAVAGYFADPARALELTPFLVQQRAEQAVWRSLGDYDLRPALRALDLPALVVHGRQDPIPVETARATAEALRADLYELERCGHVPYVERENRLLPLVRDFFS
jgi:proline iminopeptidase